MPFPSLPDMPTYTQNTSILHPPKKLMYSQACNLQLRPHTQTHTHLEMFLFVFLLSGACVLWQTLIYQLHKYSYTCQGGESHQPPLFLANVIEEENTNTCQVILKQYWSYKCLQMHRGELKCHHKVHFLQWKCDVSNRDVSQLKSTPTCCTENYSGFLRVSPPHI